MYRTGTWLCRRSRHIHSRLAPVFAPAQREWRSALAGRILAPSAGRSAPTQQVRCVFHKDNGSLTFDLPSSGTASWRAVVRVLRSPVDVISCVVYPTRCALCGHFLPHFLSAPICETCWSEIPAASGSACHRCGDALSVPAGSEVALCRTCRLAPPPFERAVASAIYDGRMRDAIHALKYQRLKPAARPLGRLLAAAIAQLADQAPAEMLVVPVPLHRSKLHGRGFNQARSLAVEALKGLRSSHPNWRLSLAPATLLRQRATESQAGLTPRQRRLNLRGVFRVSDAAAVAGNDVLLIDDILTTGATARSAAKALLEAGARSVWVATLARARRHTPIHSGSTAIFAAGARADQSESVHPQPASMFAQDQPSFE